MIIFLQMLGELERKDVVQLHAEVVPMSVCAGGRGGKHDCPSSKQWILWVTRRLETAGSWKTSLNRRTVAMMLTRQTSWSSKQNENQVLREDEDEQYMGDVTDEFKPEDFCDVFGDEAVGFSDELETEVEQTTLCVDGETAKVGEMKAAFKTVEDGNEDDRREIEEIKLRLRQ